MKAQDGVHFSIHTGSKLEVGDGKNSLELIRSWVAIKGEERNGQRGWWSHEHESGEVEITTVNWKWNTLAFSILGYYRVFGGYRNRIMSRAVAPNVAADAELDDGFTESELLSTTLPTPSTYSSTQYSQSSSRPAPQAPPVQPKLNVEGKIGSAVPIVGGPILINMPKIDTLDESVAVTLVNSCAP